MSFLQSLKLKRGIFWQIHSSRLPLCSTPLLWSRLGPRQGICPYSNPHLKASTSSSQGRRQGPSTASGRRGSARQYSGPSSSQRASSPFRQQSAKKGDARFHKKSSGTPQKRGGVFGSRSLVPHRWLAAA